MLVKLAFVWVGMRWLLLVCILGVRILTAEVVVASVEVLIDLSDF